MPACNQPEPMRRTAIKVVLAALMVGVGVTAWLGRWDSKPRSPDADASELTSQAVAPRESTAEAAPLPRQAMAATSSAAPSLSARTAANSHPGAAETVGGPATVE